MDQETSIRRDAMARRHPVWIETTLDAYLDRAAEDFADSPLVITDAVTMTYADVVRQSERMAAGLLALGIARGDPVGLIMANYPVTVPLMFAIWRVGGVVVPLNTMYRPDELRDVLHDSGCALLIVMARFGSRDFVADLNAVVPGWRDGKSDLLPELRAAIIYDENDHASFLSKLERPGEAPRGIATPHDPAVVMFTSGTTGTPKGAIQTHDNITRAVYAGAYHQAFPEGRRAVFSLPLYHSFGLYVGLLSGIVVGGAIIPLLRFKPDHILTAIGRHRATFLMGVPTMTAALIEEAKAAPAGTYDFSSLTAIHSGAAPTPSWVWRDIQRTFGCEEIFTSYGQTEVTATIVCTQPGDPIDIVAETQGCVVNAGVAGIPELGGLIAECKTIDPETGADLPPGTAGELCTRGPLNCQGYYRRPEETEKLFMADGWLRMGDLGQFRPDGNLFLTGRSKDIYKSRGEVVSPKELEQMLTLHPAINQAFFIGMPDERWGECGCAWIVRNEDHAITGDEIVSYLSEKVARYKLPRDIWFIDDADLPKTGTGKVQKNRLKEMAIDLLRQPADPVA